MEVTYSNQVVLPGVTVTVCNVCFALVPDMKTTEHTGWHNNPDGQAGGTDDGPIEEEPESPPE